MSEETELMRAEPGSWELAMDLLDRGDPAFVTEFRAVRDADKLGPFAREWFNDRRPASRRLLLAYLDQPMNALRHEPLVKRLFKLAEEAGLKVVMNRCPKIEYGRLSGELSWAGVNSRMLSSKRPVLGAKGVQHRVLKATGE